MSYPTPSVGCRDFQRLSRRDALAVGGGSLFGLTMTDLLRARETAPARNAPAKQVILLWLHGGPPQTDMFDMKPDRPEEIRGPFQPIETTVPGLRICEKLPRVAQLANKFNVLRSVHSHGYPEAGGHHAGLSWKTGNPRGLRGTPKFPMFGCVTSKLLPTPADLPSFVALGDINQHAPAVRESYVGPAYDPLSIPDDRRYDATQPMLAPQIEAAGFERNIGLLRALDAQSRKLDAAKALHEGLDRFQAKAFDLLRSPKLREALDIERESEATRERYGCKLEHYSNKYLKGNLHCQKVLVARRLIEAGVPFVYVDFAYWDWHNGNGIEKALVDLACFDAAYSSLLTDLDERGLLDSTMVLAFGEMGRTPKIGSKSVYGREHWAPAQFVLTAGGGWSRGQVVGATDADAAYVKDKEYKLASLGKSIYHLLGIDPDTELYNTDGRPLKLITEDVPLIREAMA